MEEKLTVEEAATYLKTTRQRIGRLIRRGVLIPEASHIDSRKKLIPIEQLNKIMSYSQKEESKPIKAGIMKADS